MQVEALGNYIIPLSYPKISFQKQQTMLFLLEYMHKVTGWFTEGWTPYTGCLGHEHVARVNGCVLGYACAHAQAHMHQRMLCS